jgi:hypothetical protein
MFSRLKSKRLRVVLAIVLIFIFISEPGYGYYDYRLQQVEPAVNQSSVQPLTIEKGPTFVCNLMDRQAAAVGIGGADLGVSVVDGSKLWLIFGDTKEVTGPGQPAGGQPVFGSSSVIESQLPFSCSSYTWLTSGGKFYQPLHSARQAGTDESTVPAGAITDNGAMYIYSMQVDQWGSDPPASTHAHGVLFKEQMKGTFTELTRWPTDKLFVNTAPIGGQLPDGSPVIFMATSAQYRHSPVYLAYVVPSEFGDPAGYHYLTGYEKDGSPLWSADMAEAKPLPGFENVWVGELSFLYDAPLKTYLLMFVDYSGSNAVKGVDLYSSSTPYGPFSGPLTFFPCLTTTSRPQWMESGWGGCYGGYMLPNSFGADGHDLSFALSVWIPYTTVLMTMRINTSSTTGSTSSASRSSMNTQTSTSIASRTTESTAGTTQLSLGNQEYIIAIAIVLAAAILAVAILKRSYQRHRQSSTPTRNQPGVVN